VFLAIRWRVSVEQSQAIEVMRERVSAVEQKEQAAVTRAKQAEEEQRKLRGELRTAELEANASRATLASIQQITNSPAAKGESLPGGKGQPGINANFLKQMMDNPEMRKMIEAQQKTMVDMMYAPMFKELGLSSEEAEKLKSLLLDRQMKAVSQAGALMDPAKKQDALKEVGENAKQMEEQIKSLLGEEHYGKYQEYTATMGERMVLNQFGQTSNLKPEQNDALLQLMIEEKKSAMASNPGAVPDPNDPSQGVKMLESEESAEKFLKQQEEINARVLERAQTVLSPEQLQSFASFQTNQVNMQRLGLKMAKTMFQSNPDPAGTPPATGRPAP
jgi:hypothetical protein